MNASNQLEFTAFNHVPECSAWVNKYFSYYVIQYAESGELNFQVDNNSVQRLKGPVVWLTFPGPYFRFGRRDGGIWHHRFVSFKGQLPDAYAAGGLFPCSTPVIKISDPLRFNTAFDRLLARLAVSTGPEFRTIHTLEEILLQLSEQEKSLPNEPEAVIKIRAIAAKIELNPPVRLDWQKTARDIGVSYPYFRKIFRNVFKTPPARFLLLKKLSKSASMLRSGNATIENIAGQCGFYDVFHYSKLFRKYYGAAPGQYRRNHMLR